MERNKGFDHCSSITSNPMGTRCGTFVSLSFYKPNLQTVIFHVVKDAPPKNKT